MTELLLKLEHTFLDDHRVLTLHAVDKRVSTVVHLRGGVAHRLVSGDEVPGTFTIDADHLLSKLTELLRRHQQGLTELRHESRRASFPSAGSPPD